MLLMFVRVALLLYPSIIVSPKYKSHPSGSEVSLDGMLLEDLMLLPYVSATMTSANFGRDGVPTHSGVFNVLT